MTMKQKITVFLCAVSLMVLTSFSTLRADNVDRTEWMKGVQDTTLLCRLSIPGTHDSGAMTGGPFLQTQGVGISEQLAQGIRAFDIRLQEREGKLGIFHSHVFQRIYWEEDVLPVFVAFLRAHPSETLIVSLKKEGGALRDYASLLSASLRDSVYQPYFIADFRPELRLKECRGKILFLHRDSAMNNYPGAACIGWKDNCSCLLTLRDKRGREGYVLLQDEYQYQSDKEADRKIDACICNFERVSGESASLCRWGISFVSATGLPLGTPRTFAEKINKPVADYIERAGRRNYGIVFIDFVDAPGGNALVENLIDSNFAEM